MSISMFIAAALSAVPAKKTRPPMSKMPLRPVVVVTRPATRDESNPDTYNEEVNAVRAWLSNMQY